MPIVLFALYGFVRSIFSNDYGIGFGYWLLVFWPFVLAGIGVTTLDGVLLIRHIVKQKRMPVRRRVLLSLGAFALLVPLLTLASLFAIPAVLKMNADRILSNNEARALIENCKVTNIIRDETTDKNRVYLHLDQNQLSELEKVYRFSYRSFSPDYFDELLALTQSQDIQARCGGNIRYEDSRRTQLPTTFTWVTSDDARARIEACDITHIYYQRTTPPTAGKQITGSKTQLLLEHVPTPSGISNRLYFDNIDRNAMNHLIEYAKLKWPACNRLPSIE